MATIPLIAGTDFGAMHPQEKKVWSMKLWREQRNKSFLTKFLGNDPTAMIQRVSELKATEVGDKAVITLVANSSAKVTAGDNLLLGREDTMALYDMEIRLDQARMAMGNKGRMSEQRAVVKFRDEGKSQLGYNMSKMTDELAFLTMSGVPYTNKLDGSTRNVDDQISSLSFAADVTAPSLKRHFRWDHATGTIKDGSTAAVKPVDKLSYDALIQLKAIAVDTYLRGLNGDGSDLYHMFLGPRAMASLKADPEFRDILKSAAAALGQNSELFKGGIPLIDGLVLHETRYTYNTRGAAAGSKWGTAGDVDGERVLLCGAQALAYADIGAPYWDEEIQDYGNKQGISVGKIFGMKKPVFNSTYTNSVEDVGVMAFDVAV